MGELHDDVDLRLHDRVALEEIELYAELLSAVAAADLEARAARRRPRRCWACAGPRPQTLISGKAGCGVHHVRIPVSESERFVKTDGG